MAMISRGERVDAVTMVSPAQMTIMAGKKWRGFT
jgi:hypothetical protein